MFTVVTSLLNIVGIVEPRAVARFLLKLSTEKQFEDGSWKRETGSAKLPSPLSPSLLFVVCMGETGKKGQDATELHKQPAAVFVI